LESQAPRPPFTPAGWRDQPVEVRRLIGIRALRAVAQGALSVDFVLYLDALHWSGSAIGILLTAQGLLGAALMMAIGPLSDRVGRRSPLIVYEVLTAIGAILIVLDPAAAVLVAASMVLGFGRGANGSAGPFSPAEQAWLALVSAPRGRSRIFSLNSAASFWGMGAGSLLAGVIAHLTHGLPPEKAYLPVFAMAGAVALVNAAQLSFLRERRLREGRRAAGRDPAALQEVRREENRSLWRLAGVNAVNAMGIGLTGPLLPYFFALRFGVGPEAVGPVYALAFVFTGVASVATGELSARYGLVRTVVRLRSLGILLLAALPFMPSFGLAALLYILRSVVNRGTVGVRQAFGVSLVGDERRGFASSVNNLSMRLPNSIGPLISGLLFDTGILTVPFVLAAGFQALYVVLFGRVFGARPNAQGPTDGPLDAGGS